MKKLVFSLISIGLLLFLCVALIVAFFSFMIFKKATIPIDLKTKYIMIGHSHPECAYNDSLITNFSNLSSSGESYFYAYYKAKMILKNKNNIKVAFIELTNNQVNKYMDQWIWGQTYINEKFIFYLPFIEFDDYKLLQQKNPGFLLETIPYFIKKNSFYLITNNYNYKKLGKYSALNLDKTELLLKKLVVDDRIDTSSSIFHIMYLKKLISFFQSQNIEVCLVRTPQHEKYPGYCNERKYKEVIKTHFIGVTYLDLGRFPLLNSEFADLQHLNFRGAKRYSLWFNNLLMNDSILYKTNKQVIIDNKIEQLKKQQCLTKNERH